MFVDSNKLELAFSVAKISILGNTLGIEKVSNDGSL